MKDDTVTVDVREDIRTGQEPFSKIMSVAAALGPAQELLLIAPFEPVPLFGVLKKQGFGHASHPLPSGDWEVRFTRQADESLPVVNPSQQESAAFPSGGTVLDVDARGLEPPQPMITILEALARLAEGAQLTARTDRRPMHLYPQLEQRGFTAETTEQSDGSFLTHIH